jgi:DNA-binding PucR family transcriptional regulator
MARQVVPGEATPLDVREERRRLVARLAPARRLLLRGDASSVELRAIAAATPDDPLGLDLAGRVADVIGRSVAVSRAFDEPTARPQADAEARALLEAADELAGLEPPLKVLRADRLAVYRMLGGLHNLPDGERHARALLAPVLKGSPQRRDQRLTTLRALVDGGGPAQVAAALAVHRNTVAYRIRSIEAATGWDLSDPDLRLALGIALRIVQKAQS